MIYIILFGFLAGYTYVFQETYNISQGLTGLCFVGIIIGLFGASALVPLIYKWAKQDLQKIKEKGRRSFAAGVQAMVQHARWLLRNSDLAILDGLDCETGYLYMESSGFVCTLWLWYVS